VFTRYRRDESGRLLPRALVYTQAEHGIRLESIDPEAYRIVKRLKDAGHQAYIVGGAVRDLLLGREPKDFDLVTDAYPPKIKKIFRNARIIGKRFRLVHITSAGTIYEVSTFRSIKNGSVGNEFGSIDEDALRRDFTFNALYYDPTDRSLLDFTGGFKDLKARKLKPIIPLGTIFKEDPVRILRGLKYAVSGGFSIPLPLKLAMKRDAHLLKDVSPSRLTEEFFKILASGISAPVFRSLAEHRILEFFMPSLWALMRRDLEYSTRLFADLELLDSEKPASIRGSLQRFLQSYLSRSEEPEAEAPIGFPARLSEVRAFIAPMNPPRLPLEAALVSLCEAMGEDAQPPAPRVRRRLPRKAQTAQKDPETADSPRT